LTFQNKTVEVPLWLFLIPADIDAFHPEGERQFYLFLMKVAKPDPGYKKK